MQEITTSVQIVLPQHCNGYARPRLFGGQIMAWIDITGAVAARRYTCCPVTTVCVDNLNFIAPAYLNDTVVQEARVTWTGRTSLEVRVDSFVEKLDGSRQQHRLIERQAYLERIPGDRYRRRPQTGLQGWHNKYYSGHECSDRTV